MAEEKDNWDKTDVLLRALVPLLVAISLLVWNRQRDTQQTASTMTGIAVGILAEKPTGGENDPLRDWAISVLQNPKSPPTLSDQAALQLKSKNLTFGLDAYTLPSRLSSENFDSLLKEMGEQKREQSNGQP